MLTLLQAIIFGTVLGVRGIVTFEPALPNHMTQPPAWAQMKDNRNEFGIFERHGR